MSPSHDRVLRLCWGLTLSFVLGCDKVEETLEDLPILNDEPTMLVSQPVSGQYYKSDALLSFAGQIEDDDLPEELTVRVLSDRDGDLGELTVAEDLSFSGELSLSDGLHTLLVEVEDVAGQSESIQVQIEYGPNRAPSAPGVTLQPNAPTPADDLTALITLPSTDPDGDPFSYVWAWYQDGKLTDITGDTVPADRTLPYESWTVAVYADDGVSSSTVATDSITLPDGGPVISVSLSPTQAYVDSSLSCSWNGTDPYGFEVALEGRWLLDGKDIGSAEEDLAEIFSKHQEVSCQVTGVSSSGTSVETATLSILNTAPEVDSINLSPTTAYEGSTLVCEAEVSDADPEDTLEKEVLTLLYSWYVNGSVVSSEETLTGEFFDRGDQVWCLAQVTDGEDSSSSLASGSLVIFNSAPETATVELSAAEVESGELLTCSVLTEASDPDGDSITYTMRWTVDGSVHSESSELFDTTGLTGGTTVGCSVDASDGSSTSGYSAEATAMVRQDLDGSYSADAAGALLLGTSTTGQLTVSLSPGDVDGDGLPEILLGAEGANSSTGGAYLFYGSTLQGRGGELEDSSADQIWYGDSGASLGAEGSLAGLGDLAGDSMSELVLGSPEADLGGIGSVGVVSLLLSEDRSSWTDGGQPSDSAEMQVYGLEVNDGCGTSVSTGDLDGDGLDELLVGCPGANGSEGVLAIFYGASVASGDLPYVDADVLLFGDHGDAMLGSTPAQVGGDWNGDGSLDLMIPVPQGENQAGVDSGAVFLLSGDSLTTATPAALAFLSLEGSESGEGFGSSAASVGDLDGDSADELIVGSPRASVEGSSSGEVYLWMGSTELSGVDERSGASVAWSTADGGGELGTLVAAADMDGDSLDELVFSDPYSDSASTNAGAVYMLHGSAWGVWTGDLESDAAASVFGSSSSDLLGYGLSLSDFGGDGYLDLFLGAYGLDDGASNGGGVYVFRGP